VHTIPFCAALRRFEDDAGPRHKVQRREDPASGSGINRGRTGG